MLYIVTSLLSLGLSVQSSVQSTAACPNPTNEKYGLACTCTASSCGSFEVPAVSMGSALLVRSVHSRGFFMTETKPLAAKTPAGDVPNSGDEIELKAWRDAKMKIRAAGMASVGGGHPVDGFGSAFTDAMAYNFESLDNATRSTFIEVHFGATGLGYSMGRVHMGASDFSRMDYTLANQTDDFGLSSFCLRDDSAVKVPCGTDYKMTPIFAAQATLHAAERDALKLYVSAWSPPTWMKDQQLDCNAVDGLPRCHANATAPPLVRCTASVAAPCEGQPIGARCPQSDGHTMDNPQYVGVGLDHNTREWAEGLIRHNAAGNCYYSGMLSANATKQQALADLYVRFIDAYAARGIDMWGMTVQNEPLTQTGLWNGMFYTANLQASFVKTYLGPTLRKAFPALKIMIHDDATNELNNFAKDVLADPEASAFIDGIGYHWYTCVPQLAELPGSPPSATAEYPPIASPH